jgi:predicted nucleotidyltransferase
MMSKRSIKLSGKNQIALQKVKSDLMKVFKIKELIVYGSVARGEETVESDLDLLVITEEPVSHADKQFMSDIVFEVNLEYETNVSILIVDTETWEQGLWSVLPIYQEIARDGVSI